MMYLCPICGAVNPDYHMVRHEDNSHEYGNAAWYSCPDCEYEFPSLEEYEAEDCPVCHVGHKYKNFPTCLGCAICAEKKLRRFLHAFTAEELEAMDIMIEGEPLDNFAKGEKSYAVEAFYRVG